VRRIAFIKHAQHCGFSLAEIGALLEMHKADASGRSNAYRLAVRKHKEIGDTIASLQAMAAALRCVLDSRTASPIDDVELTESPLLDALETEAPAQRPGASIVSGQTAERQANRMAA
jgi:MerR family Zn(II)-responsive transcriptional regulator of zntA